MNRCRRLTYNLQNNNDFSENHKDTAFDEQKI